MKAAVYHGPGDLRVEEIDRPDAGDVGVVVKVRAVGICGTDVHAYRGPTGYATGKALGHEFSGDVVDVGRKVTGIRVGDRIWAGAMLPCFQCEACGRQEYFRCGDIKGGGVSGLHGAFAEYAWVPVAVLNRNVIRIADSVSYQDAALTEPAGVGVGTAHRAEPSDTDTVVIVGVGVVGLGAVAALKDTGVARIIASDMSVKRLAAAGELGADVLIDPTEEDVVGRVMEETSGTGADIVVEAAGKPVTFLQSIDMVRRDGKVMVVATYEEPFQFHPSLTRPGMRMSSLVRKAVRMYGCYGGDNHGAYDLIRRGELKASQLVTHVFPLDEIETAFETQMNSQESIKVMIEPQGDG
jgi:2-desacetyl-2-hydroxyethyl bacteriochlorophyllide A dehydrogenase